MHEDLNRKWGLLKKMRQSYYNNLAVHSNIELTYKRTFGSFFSEFALAKNCDYCGDTALVVVSYKKMLQTFKFCLCVKKDEAKTISEIVNMSIIEYKKHERFYEDIFLSAENITMIILGLHDFTIIDYWDEPKQNLITVAFD